MKAFIIFIPRWRVVKIDEVESETDLDSINDYNLDCENGSKVLEDIVKISEKRRKFDVVSVTHGINGIMLNTE